MTLSKLNKSIVTCRKCDRLVNFREKIAKEKRKQYLNEIYWGKPITGYGDKDAKLLMVGLAPAAHGGNRTGRVFTGDKSADFLFKCLYEAGFCNQPISINRNDGLVLKNLYLTTALKCVPPQDKPTSLELRTCFNFFNQEIKSLKKISTILALGKIGYDTCVNYYKQYYDIKNKNYNFGHGSYNILPDNKILIGSYHPSPRNVNTGRINKSKMVSLLKKVKKELRDI
jgi:uracil-DNA glycosylase family 4|tara:strand:- start:157 stop:837 length:681 start_codon:yes stop_codon:yes gene_type:complete